MPVTRPVTFGRFRLDATNERLWRGVEAVSLRPKVFAVLRHLVEHRGELVTKQQLLEAVWPSTFVGDAVLKDSIRQLREALGDDAAAPRYIETAHRRGYRFIGEISDESARSSAASPVPTAVSLLGRTAELVKMHGWLERALRGERQLVFVTGEPGIGKTTLVNAAVEQAAAVQRVRVARGQCLEQYGAGEAYLPVLDGFSRLARGPDGERIVALLRQHAPEWLIEFPALLSASDRELSQRHVFGSTRERRLRELADAIEAITVEDPLIFVLEDLHWSDHSTLDLVAYLARRRDPARLLLIGTYRPVDVILGEHALKRLKPELQAHGLCHELALEYLSQGAIAQYLDVRFSRHQLPRNRLARLIHGRSEGNPLFMVNLVEYLVDEAVIVESEECWTLGKDPASIEAGVPENVRQLIERQVERLSPDERRVLEGASVVGMECSSVAIAAGLDAQTAWVEECCEALVRRYQFLSPARLVELPDGTITPRYTFSHVLYRDVPYNLLPAMRRAQIHRRIGDRGEVIYGDRVGEIAAELAMHFEVGRDTARAVKYLLLAAENATHWSAHHEAAALARRGLHALAALPDAPERAESELKLRMILAISLVVTKGFAAAEADEISRGAWQLCGRHPDSPDAFKVLRLMGLSHMFHAEIQVAHEIGERLMVLASRLRDSTLVMEAHRALGGTCVESGKLKAGVEHFDRAVEHYVSARHPSYVLFTGHDPKVVSECARARALWALGYPDRALEGVTSALALAHQLSHVQSVVSAAYYAAHLHLLRREPALSQQQAQTAIALAEEHGLELWAAVARIHQAWAAVAQGNAEEGVARFRRELAVYERTAARVWRPCFLGLFAEALARAERLDEAIAAVEEGLTLARKTGELYFDAELHRIKGELLLVRPTDDAGTEAEACFREALAIARRQEARSWELRIATSLGRLLGTRGTRQEARAVVRAACDWFTEGRGTADFKRATTLLSAL
jgi:DNA-binding winged helix-turn-helix (wHTH) protein/predicted ATPase